MNFKVLLSYLSSCWSMSSADLHSMKRSKTFHGFILCLISLILMSCSNDLPSESKENNQNNIEKPNKQEILKMNQITPPEGEFLRVAGWLDSQHILYITNLETGSNLYVYDVVQGISEPFFKSPEPVASAYISPSGKYVAMHSSPTTNSAIVTVLDQKGKPLWTKGVSAFDLTVEWNPFDESIFFFSSFNEDWTFKSFLVNIKEETMVDVKTRQPFVKWVNREEFAFLDWEEDSPSLFAPVIKVNSKTGEEEVMLEDVYHFYTYKDFSFAITLNKNDRNKAMYDFYKQKFTDKRYSFTIPQLSRYSDWLIPFYDYVREKDKFITFVPLKHGEADLYRDGFNLMAYDLSDKMDGEVLVANMENEPLSCRASGDYCLYGFRYEKLLDITAGEMVHLFE